MVLNRLRSYTNRKKKQPKTLCLPGSKHFHDRIAVGPSAVCSCYTMHTGRTVAPGTKYKKHFNTGKKQQQQKIGKDFFQPSIANMEIANVALTDLTERSFRSWNFMDFILKFKGAVISNRTTTFKGKKKP